MKRPWVSNVSGADKPYITPKTTWNLSSFFAIPIHLFKFHTSLERERRRIHQVTRNIGKIYSGLTGRRFEHLWLNVQETQVSEKKSGQVTWHNNWQCIKVWRSHYQELNCFLWYGWPTKCVWPYFQPGPLSEILTIANLRHAASRVWTCAEPEFRLSWMKLCSSDNHYICRKVNSKLSALSRLARYLSMKQKKLLYMSLIEAQVIYCPWTWMFCSRSCNNKINKLH